MSSREKNLLIFLGFTLFVIANFVAINVFYLPALNKAKIAEGNAERDLKRAESVLESREQIEPDMRWLERSGTAETTVAAAQSKLQAFLRKQALARNLEIRDSQILVAQEGFFYDRVRVSFKLSGRERDVFAWLTTIHQPNQRQIVTSLEIKPMSSDLTRVDVAIEVEKWIITPDEV